MVKKYYVVKVFLLNSQGELLVLHRSHTAPRRALTWDLPGGFVDPGESPVDAALRELREETDAKIAKINKALEIVDEKKDKVVFRYFFIAFAKKANIQISYEHDDYRWIAIDDFLSMVSYAPLVSAFEKLLKQTNKQS